MSSLPASFSALAQRVYAHACLALRCVQLSDLTNKQSSCCSHGALRMPRCLAAGLPCAPDAQHIRSMRQSLPRYKAGLHVWGQPRAEGRPALRFCAPASHCQPARRKLAAKRATLPSPDQPLWAYHETGCRFPIQRPGASCPKGCCERVSHAAAPFPPQRPSPPRVRHRMEGGCGGVSASVLRARRVTTNPRWQAAARARSAREVLPRGTRVPQRWDGTSTNIRSLVQSVPVSHCCLEWPSDNWTLALHAAHSRRRCCDKSCCTRACYSGRTHRRVALRTRARNAS